MKLRLLFLVTTALFAATPAVKIPDEWKFI